MKRSYPCCALNSRGVYLSVSHDDTHLHTQSTNRYTMDSNSFMPKKYSSNLSSRKDAIYIFHLAFKTVNKNAF